MSKTDESAGMFLLDLAHVVIDGPAYSEVRLVEAHHAGKNRGIDSGEIHHANMGIDIAEQRIEQMHGIAALIDSHRDLIFLALEQGRGRVVVLEIDDHVGSSARQTVGISQLMARVGRNANRVARPARRSRLLASAELKYDCFARRGISRE